MPARGARGLSRLTQEMPPEEFKSTVENLLVESDTVHGHERHRIDHSKELPTQFYYVKEPGHREQAHRQPPDEGGRRGSGSL